VYCGYAAWLAGLAICATYAAWMAMMAMLAGYLYWLCSLAFYAGHAGLQDMLPKLADWLC